MENTDKDIIIDIFEGEDMEVVFFNAKQKDLVMDMDFNYLDDGFFEQYEDKIYNVVFVDKEYLEHPWASYSFTKEFSSIKRIYALTGYNPIYFEKLSRDKSDCRMSMYFAKKKSDYEIH